MKIQSGNKQNICISFLFQSAASTLIVYSCLLTAATSLLCFQCGTTSESDDCIDDWSGLVNTSLGLSDYYTKDCTETSPNWTRCMIQTAEINGRRTLFHRGCHDGRTFSSLYTNSRFWNLPTNNATTCATVETTREFVCFTFCSTDFCNGPQPPLNNTEKLSRQCENFDEDSAYVITKGALCGKVSEFKGGYNMLIILFLCTYITLSFLTRR